jgi:hypothetical protein
MKHFILAVIFFSVFPFFSSAQDSKLNCQDIKTGIFYYYPKNSTGPYIVYMTDGFEKDIDMITGDTTLWEIDRIDDCSYKQLLIATNDRNVTEGNRKALKKHKIISKTLAITDDYLIYADYLDKISDQPFARDTAWFHEKIDYKNSAVYQRITDSSYITNAHFTDTSKYALLYVYRPGRTMRIFDRYPIYINDVFICEAKNKIGYLFKIYKEGTYTFKSRIYYNADSVAVDIKFGKTYYVRSLELNPIKFREDKFNLKMELIDPETGQAEFNNVKFQTRQ